MRCTNISILLFFVLCLGCHHEGKRRDHHDRKDHRHQRSNPDPIDFDQRLQELGITLTEPSAPVANYVNVRQAGHILYLAGKGPTDVEGQLITGKLGADVTIEEGYAAAERVAISQISVLKDYLGDLNRVRQILKVTGMVNATPDFTNQPEVINGFSDMMVKVFGEKGKHARAAVGMGSLPRDICVEVDVIVEIYD